MSDRPWVKQGFEPQGMIPLPNGNLIMFLVKEGEVSGYAVWTAKNCIFIEPAIPLGDAATGDYRSEEPAAPEVAPRFPGLPNRGFSL